MAKELKFDFEQYDAQIAKSSMKRLRKAAGVIRDAAKAKCVVGTVTRPIKPGQPIWMGREIGAMRDTIRVVEKKGGVQYSTLGTLLGADVRVYAGNFKTWWALQMEYGRGGWKGGRKSFMRPAMRATKGQVQRIIENG